MTYKSPGSTSFEWTDGGPEDPDDPDFPNVQNRKYKYTEGFLDGPYDFAYSRVESYMDTSGAPLSNGDIKFGMKAQMLSFAPGKTSTYLKKLSNLFVLCKNVYLMNVFLTFLRYLRRWKGLQTAREQ